MQKGSQHHKKHKGFHKDAVSIVLETLRVRSHKVTSVRRQIVEAMDSAKTPMSIRDLATVVDADEASVYRTVNLLLEEDLAESIALSDESFVFALKTEHHHHLVCVSCNVVAHIDCDNEPKPHLRQTPFARIIGHDVTYYGLCRRCEKSAV